MNLAPPKILVIDDDEALRRSLSDILTASGYEADQAASAELALQRISEREYDVVILDLKLPDAAGQDLMPQIEKRSPNTEIVVVTGHASLESAIQSVTHSTVGYLLKPVDPAYLLRLIERVTERRRAIEELAHYRANLEKIVEERSRALAVSNEKLRQSERLATVGTLAAGIAHQINNPVGAILAVAEFALLTEGEDVSPDDRREGLETIAEEARRCGQIVRSVLQFSRNETTEKWRSDLIDVVQRAAAAVGPYAAERKAHVQMVSAPQPVMAELSPIQMEQVIVNVLRNAIESKPVGATVRVSVELAGERAMVRVSDDGVGLADEELRQIFDPFFTTRIDEGGTGLGLSVAHGIVVDHGGTISFDANDRRGTTVTIELHAAG